MLECSGAFPGKLLAADDCAMSCGRLVYSPVTPSSSVLMCVRFFHLTKLLLLPVVVRDDSRPLGSALGLGQATAPPGLMALADTIFSGLSVPICKMEPVEDLISEFLRAWGGGWGRGWEWAEGQIKQDVLLLGTLENTKVTVAMAMTPRLSEETRTAAFLLISLTAHVTAIFRTKCWDKTLVSVSVTLLMAVTRCLTGSN